MFPVLSSFSFTRLGWRGLSGTNTPAYLACRIWSIGLIPKVNVIHDFKIVIYERLK